MKYWLDTEFIEYPCTIDLVSIGIVSEAGQPFYAVSNEYDATKASKWVKENVLNILPKCERDIQSLKQIRDGIKEFIGCDPSPEFWGYYADYDWVVFCWIFGTMMDLPKGWPMYCRDIKQWCDQLGNPDLPEQGEGEHNALEDAWWNYQTWRFLERFEQGKDTSGFFNKVPPS